MSAFLWLFMAAASVGLAGVGTTGAARGRGSASMLGDCWDSACACTVAMVEGILTSEALAIALWGMRLYALEQTLCLLDDVV